MIHPSMTDAEMQRVTSGMTNHTVRVMMQRILERGMVAREVRHELLRLRHLIDAGSLPEALQLIDTLRAALDLQAREI